MQDALFSGLASMGAGRYRFIVFSHDPVPKAMSDGLSHEPIVAFSAVESAGLVFRAYVARFFLWVLQMLGVGGGRTVRRLAKWKRLEPKHFQQMRNLNIRLLWNMNQHELPTPTPFIRTIWEANHRIHSMYPEYSYSRFGFESLDGNMAESLARASYVITGTHEGKQQLVEMLGVHKDKVRVIPFPVPALGHLGVAKSRGSYIFYPARFWPHKNHVVILEALKILRTEHGLDLRCILTGSDEGNLDYVSRYARRLGIADLVEYRGRVSEEEICDLYAGALALVFASAVGPDNLPPLEAMGLGCPVITADVPGAREQFGDAALFFSATDERGLVDRLLELLADDGLRGTLVERGRALVEVLTSDAYVAQVMAMLDEFSLVARAWERCDSTFT